MNGFRSLARVLACLGGWLLYSHLCLASVYDGGTGAFFMVTSDTDTPYMKASANIDLSAVEIEVSGPRPVPYFFLGAHDATAYNAEAGIYFDYASEGWRPFSMIAGGTYADGEEVYGWSEPEDVLIAPTDHIQLVYEILDDAAQYSIINWTQQTTDTFTVQMAIHSLWGARTAFNDEGEGMMFYRETSLAVDPGTEDFYNTDVLFTGANFHDAYLYNQQSTMRWDDSRTNWNLTGTYPDDPDMVSLTSSADFSTNIVDFRQGAFLYASGDTQLSENLAPLPEPATLWLVAFGLPALLLPAARRRILRRV